MAVIKGDVLLLSANGNVVKGTVQNDMEATADMIDVTTNDSGGDKEYLAGERDKTFNVEGKYDPVASEESAEDIYDDWASGSEVTVIWGQQSGAGNIQWSCSALISSFSINGPKNDAATFSATLQRTGASTKTVLT